MTFNFDLTHLERFAGSSTSIRRPRECTYFSYDDNHVLKPLSTESLACYYPPIFGAPGAQEVRPDLSAGFKTFRQRDDSIDEHLDGLLDTLQAHEESLLEKARDGEGELVDVRVKADVITWRGMMTKILTVAFDDFSDFEMNATSFQGTIFVEERHAYKAAQQRTQNAQQPRRGEASQEMMQYWGYKFEAISVIPKQWAEMTREEIESREVQTVSNHVQYCSIVRTGFGTTSLVVAGEVDCVMSEKPENPDQPIPWVELKTSAEPGNLSNPREAVKYERKLMRYWAQSFLLGVPKIMVGYRTQDGFLTRIAELETQRIPAQVKRGQHTWDGNICINLTSAFLEFLRRTIGDEEGVWRIRRRRNGRVIEMTKTEAGGTGNVLKECFKRHRETLRGLEISAALG
ncbi:decapping endonuclease targeting mRNA [Elasticomyces elasticus]|nr:decapping endonuclease targeting mRNA [Elasticomyces elasticus]KAK3665732.1 decapping endonuclease targeting mRNA [Elasticomyces elasticus]KAK4926349.1 decapping endonuclease targeting mRNA [Elasticomyces elasticus]KAK5757278.1 decapping endonuclease targeting mRNA [Elasticomyces elasticus]